jgi:tetratricopeptide (TPR) repeat protein
MEALRLNPNLKEARFNLGSVLSDINRIDDAISHFLEALRIDPAYAQAHNNLGITLVKSGQADRAMGHFQKALQITPDYAAAHYNLGMLLIRHGKIEGGIYHLRETLRIKPDHAGAGNNLNWSLGVKRKMDNAVAKMDAAFLIDPASSDVKDKITSLYNSKKELDLVINQFQKDLTSLPGFTPAELNMENYPNASRADKKYRLVWPLAEKLDEPGVDRIQSNYYIACLYALQNKIEESVGWLEKAVKGGFNDWNLLRTDPNMESIRATAYYRELLRAEGLGRPVVKNGSSYDP